MVIFIDFFEKLTIFRIELLNFDIDSELILPLKLKIYLSDIEDFLSIKDKKIAQYEQQLLKKNLQEEKLLNQNLEEEKYVF